MLNGLQTAQCGASATDIHVCMWFSPSQVNGCCVSWPRSYLMPSALSIRLQALPINSSPTGVLSFGKQL